MPKSNPKERYRRVICSLWYDPDFRALSERARLLYLFLATAPHAASFPFAWRMTTAALAEEFGWDADETGRRLDELIDSGFAVVDRDAKLLFLPRRLEDEPPDNPNVKLFLLRSVDELPPCDLRERIRSEISSCKPGLKSNGSRNGSGNGSRNGSGNGMANQQQQLQPQQQLQQYSASPDGDATATLENPSATAETELPPLLNELSSLEGFRRFNWTDKRALAWDASTDRAYPLLDRIREVRKADAWCNANPPKSTFKNARRFLTNWFARADEDRRKSELSHKTCSPENGVHPGEDYVLISDQAKRTMVEEVRGDGTIGFRFEGETYERTEKEFLTKWRRA